MALPKDAVVDVSLIDASRAAAPSVALSQVRIKAGGKQVPIPFSVACQPSKLRPGGICQVRATISTGGHPSGVVVLTLVRVM